VAENPVTGFTAQVARHLKYVKFRDDCGPASGPFLFELILPEKIYQNVIFSNYSPSSTYMSSGV
jgi:hypothetical protein